MRVLLNNGSPGTFDALMIYTLADADSITQRISQPYVHPAGLSIEQGASALQTVRVPVDKDYKPVKLLIECGGCPVVYAFPSAAHYDPEHTVTAGLADTPPRIVVCRNSSHARGVAVVL